MRRVRKARLALRDLEFLFWAVAIVATFILIIAVGVAYS